MAENRTINIDINQNAEEAAKGFNNLNNALDETNKSVRDVNKTFEEVYGDLQPLTTRLGEAEDRLYELALAGQTTTQEYKDLLQTVANYRQIQIQTDAVVDAASTRFDEKLGGALQGAASGFAGVQGAMALMGTESEALEKTLVKLQGAMAIAEGVRGIREGITSLKALGMQGKAAFQGMTTASKAFALTGIGLVLTGVGLLIANWDKLTGKEKFNYDQFKQQAEEKLALLELQNQALDRQYNNISKSSDDAIKGIEREIKIAELQGKNTDELYKRKSELIQKTATETIKSTESERDAIKKRYAELEAVQGGLLENHTFYLKQKSKLDSDSFKSEAEKRRAAIDVARYEEAKALRDRAYQLRDFRNAEFDKAEAAEDDLKIMKLQKQKELRDKAKATRDADLSELRGYIKEASKLYSQSQMDDTEKAIDEIKRKYERQLALAKKYKKGTAEIETAMMNEINDIHLAKVNEQIAQEQEAREQARLNRIAQENELFAQIEDIAEQNYQRTLTEQEKEILAVNDKYFELETLAQGNADALNEIEIAKLNELNDINLKYDAEEKARKDAADAAERERIKRNRDFAVEMTLSGLNTISSLTELFGKKSEKAAKRAFQINKAAQIASATITTYKSATDAYASQFVPIPDATSPIRGGIAAGVAVAAGLANIAKIASQKFEGGGSSGGGGGTSAGGGGTESFAPQFNVIGNSGINQLAQLQQQPVQAYVVSGEVTSAQALDRNRQKNATL